jgi:non-heme chloroperoxidase
MGTLGKVAGGTILLFAVCVSGTTRALADHKPPTCIDTPPYDTVPYKAERFVRVALGVKLEVLDWGGSGEPMVLLTGLGDNAHVFDYFAYQFTDYFHVIGITRRGWLPSSQPKTGYDVKTRAADDIEVLNALGIKKAVFVGHSVAGSELSEIALKYPSYVDKLVYLDATDLSKRFTIPEIPSAFDLFTKADAQSIFTYEAAYARLLGVREPVAPLCLTYKFAKDGRVTGTSTPASIQDQLSRGVRAPANPPVNWAAIKEPRLGIFAPPTAESKLPWYPYLNPAKKAEFNARFPGLLQWYGDEIGLFEAKHPGNPTPVVHLLPGAPHYVFINNEAEVVLWMREFLGLPVAGNP